MSDFSDENLLEDDQLNINETLSDFLEDGIDVSEFPELQAQLNFSEIHRTFAKLFSGSSDKIALKLFMLNELFSSTTHEWKIQQINQRFSFIKENVRVALLNNFRSANLISYDDYHAIYELTDLAYKIQSILTSLQSVEGEDSIGLLATGLKQTVDLETDPLPHLNFLVKKLKITSAEYERAIEFRSEDALRKGLQQQSESAKYYDEATKALKVIADEDYKNFNRDIHEAAQEVAEIQSSFSYLETRMNSTLNQIERHKVSLSDFGYNFDELRHALKSKDADFLADFVQPLLRKTARPLFLTEQFMDEALEELFYMDEEPEESSELHAVDESSSEVLDEEKLEHCIDLTHIISEKKEPTYTDLVKNVHWEEACYRLSMLGMLEGETGSEENNDPISEFRKLPFTIENDIESSSAIESERLLEETYSTDDLRNTPFRELTKGRVVKK